MFEILERWLSVNYLLRRIGLQFDVRTSLRFCARLCAIFGARLGARLGATFGARSRLATLQFLKLTTSLIFTYPS